MDTNFLCTGGLQETHMDALKPFESKLVTYTYIGYSEQNHHKNTIVWHPHENTTSLPHPLKKLSYRAFI